MKDNLLENMNAFLPLRDVVFNTLRQAILTGELKPGERLLEIHLANRLGVSRTPIREAIHKLELEGLVTLVPRRGAEVAQITEKSMNDVLEVRRTLDALCAELACDRITEEELKLQSETDLFADSGNDFKPQLTADELNALDAEAEAVANNIAKSDELEDIDIDNDNLESLDNEDEELEPIDDASDELEAIDT